MSDVLSKEIYTGQYRVKEIEIEDEVLRIIDDDTFLQVQELFKERTRIGMNAFGKSQDLEDSVMVGLG